jgi:hypothetical protein
VCVCMKTRCSHVNLNTGLIACPAPGQTTSVCAVWGGGGVWETVTPERKLSYTINKNPGRKMKHTYTPRFSRSLLLPASSTQPPPPLSHRVTCCYLNNLTSPLSLFSRPEIPEVISTTTPTEVSNNSTAAEECLFRFPVRKPAARPAPDPRPLSADIPLARPHPAASRRSLRKAATVADFPMATTIRRSTAPTL